MRDFLFMRMLKLQIEYDGTDFAGWQIQNNSRSVQGVLEQALSQLLQEPIRIVGAGRTDAGVHATGQVAHCGTSNTMELRRVYRGLNALLPPDVVVSWVDEVPETFHARYGATARRYRYSISQIPAALDRRRCWFVGHPLDVDRMQRCAEMIMGEHDFSAFSKVDANVKHFRCRVSAAQWSRNGKLITFDITANRFLYGMVRALVGTMVDVGRNHITADDFARILESKDRREAGMSAPPQGLVLEEVSYGAGTPAMSPQSEVSENSEE